MARRRETEEKGEGEEIALELSVSEAMARPQFANYVHSNVARMDDDTPLTTLTFIHVYPIPTSRTASQPQADIVARVTLTDKKVIALRDLLIRQNPLTAAELASLRAGPRRRTGKKSS